jgi:hypothetical protein
MPPYDDIGEICVMPLKVIMKGKTMPAITALQQLNADPTLIDGLIERINELLGKKTTYQYDTAPQKEKDPVAYLNLDYNETKLLNDLAAKIGWPEPAPFTQVYQGDVQSHLPTMIKDRHKRTVRTGKLLTELKKKFPDQTNILAKIEKKLSLVPRTTEWDLIVSAEPSDILTMSTGRGWKSCVSESECNFASLDYAVSSRDMVAYAVAPNKDNWLARVWLRSDGKGKWWPESKVYTTLSISNEMFLNAVTKYLAEKGILGKQGEYHPMAKGWSDLLIGNIKQNMQIEKVQKHDPYRDVPEKPEKSLRFVPKTPTHRLFEVTLKPDVIWTDFINVLKEMTNMDFATVKGKYENGKIVYDIKMSPEAAELLKNRPEVLSVREKGAAPKTITAIITLNPLDTYLLDAMATALSEPNIANVKTMAEFKKLPDNTQETILSEIVSNLWNQVPWNNRNKFTFVRDGFKQIITTTKDNLETLWRILQGQNYTIKEK